MLNIKQNLDIMHRFLIGRKFPYHSFSVIHRENDLGFHVIFMDGVRDLVTEEIKSIIKFEGFTFSFTKK